MFGIGAPELLGLVLLLALACLFVFSAVRRQPRSAPADRRVVREWRLVQATRGLGVVVGLGAGVQVYQVGSYGVGPMLAPAAFGLCVVLATALGETLVRPRRPTGVRSASLTPRRTIHYLPRVTTSLVGVLTGVTGVTLVFTTVTASRDEGSGAMRALSCESALVASAHTPYPGSYYSLPLAGLLLAVLVVAGLAARQVVRRPRGMALTEVGEDSLRRRSLDVIVAATGIAVCAPYIGVALTAGGALRALGTSVPSCAPTWADPVGLVLLFSAPVAFFLAAWCAFRLLFGGVGDLAQPPSPVGTTTFHGLG